MLIILKKSVKLRNVNGEKSGLLKNGSGKKSGLLRKPGESKKEKGLKKNARERRMKIERDVKHLANSKMGLHKKSLLKSFKAVQKE